MLKTDKHMKNYSIEEWNKRPMLSKKLFGFISLKCGWAFFYTECDKYMIRAKVRGDCQIFNKMTAKEVALQSDEITVAKIY